MWLHRSPKKSQITGCGKSEGSWDDPQFFESLSRWIFGKTRFLNSNIVKHHRLYDVICMIWYDLIWFDIIWHYMIWCYMILYDIIWYDMILYYIIWCYMILYDILWYYMTLYDIIWYYIILLYKMILYNVAKSNNIYSIYLLLVLTAVLIGIARPKKQICQQTQVPQEGSLRI